jgi:hypothetical protein
MVFGWHIQIKAVSYLFIFFYSGRSTGCMGFVSLTHEGEHESVIKLNGCICLDGHDVQSNPLASEYEAAERIDHQRCHLPHRSVMQEIRFKALFFLLALLLPHLCAKF